MRKLTHKEQVEAIAKVNPDVEVLGEIIDSGTKVLTRCKIHDYKWFATPNTLKRGQGCPECKKEKIGNASRKTHAEHVAEIAAKSPNVEIIGQITGVTDKVLTRCKVCGYEWEVTPHSLKHGRGCPECGRIKNANSRILTHAEQVRAIAKVNPDVEVLGKITKNNVKVLCRCKVCGYEWLVVPFSLKHGEGCPKCAKRGFLGNDFGKLYIMVDDLNVPTMMKIGVSVQEDERSKQVLRSAHKAGVSISDLYVAKTWEGPTELMMRIEQMMHENYAEWNIKFPTKFDGSTEFFYYTPETAGVFDAIEEIYYTVVNQF